jgi:hypothetical protein
MAERAELRSPAREFSAYCEKEMERRLCSDQKLDAELYLEAVRLVLRKLGIGGEGGAT